MTKPTDTTARVRGVSVGAMSALVTAAAHTAGGAMAPSQSAVVLLTLVCAGLGYATASMTVFRLARVQLMVMLAAAQSVGHLVLTMVDAHHHGPILSGPMLTAHLLAVVVGACVIAGAERGIRWAISSVRRILPAVVALVVDQDVVTPPAPVYRVPAAPRLMDLSGSGTRGPPVLA